jgi:hypothetical protein
MVDGFHEKLDETSVSRRSSERSFGILAFLIFQVVAIYFYISYGEKHLYFAFVGFIFGIATLFAPGTLFPLNFLWIKFGLLLHRLISPIIISFLYIACILPVGMLMRIFGKRPLNLKFEPNKKTYWIAREKHLQPSRLLNQQF